MSDMANVKELKHIRLSEAENGWNLSWTEVLPPSDGKTYSNNEWCDREMVFSDAQTDEAFEKLRSLHMFNKAKKRGDAPTATEMTVTVKASQ